MRGIEGFDATRGFKLQTYARPWIDVMIRHEVSRFRAPVAMPSQIRDALNQRSTATRLHVIARSLVASGRSFDATDLAGLSLEDRLASPGPAVDDALADAEENADRKTALRNALLRLRPRERAVITMRFLGDETPTLDACGQILGCSREYVRQLEMAAFEKLTSILGSPDDVKTVHRLALRPGTCARTIRRRRARSAA